VDQTSGTSNFGDHPISGTPDLTVRSDDDDIYTWEKERADDWVLRKVDVAVTELGVRLGVKTAIVHPPLICKSLCRPFVVSSSSISNLTSLGRWKGRWASEPALPASSSVDQNSSA
jgi:hypothetical protein